MNCLFQRPGRQRIAAFRTVVACLLLIFTAGRALADNKTAADSILRSILAIKDRSTRMQALYDTCIYKYADAPQYAKLFAAAFQKEQLQQPNDTNAAKAAFLLGDVALIAGDYDASLKYCLEALSLAKRRNMFALQIGILSDISGVYLRTNDPPRSMQTIREALAIAREHGFREQEAKLMNFLAIRYAVSGKYREAILVADSALVMARQLHLLKLQENTLENKAIVYRLMGKHELALATLQAALPITDTLDITNVKAGLHYQLGTLYLKMHRLAESEQMARQAQALSGEVNDPAFIIAMDDLLATIYFEKGEYKTAFEYLQQQMLLKDSVFTENKAAQIQELQARYDTDLKNKQLAAQSAQIRSNKKINLFLGISSALLFVIGLLIYLNQRKTKKLNVCISRQSEELQHKSRELEHLNQVKDRLFSTISHDMRTPVNSLLSFTMLLDQGAVPAEKLAVYATELKNNLGYTAGLMDNLLNFARSQMQGYQPKIEPVDLADTTTDAVSLLAATAQQKSIAVHNLVTPGTRVMADVNMMALIIRNLLTNAIKFTHHNGTIRLSAGPGKPGSIDWQIQDSGIGIDAALVSAFNRNNDPNEQPLAHTPGTNREKGTGLGLLLSKSFLALMNGTITVHSETGKGTTFIISLPAAN